MMEEEKRTTLTDSGKFTAQYLIDWHQAMKIQREMQRTFDRGLREDVPEIGEILGRLKS